MTLYGDFGIFVLIKEIKYTDLNVVYLREGHVFLKPSLGPAAMLGEEPSMEQEASPVPIL